MSNWKRIIKVLERENLELVEEGEDEFTTNTGPEVGPGTEPDDTGDLGTENRKGIHCKCEGKKCKFEANWKCRRCGSQKCTLHKKRAENYKVGPSRTKSSHIHKFRPWKCDPDNPMGQGEYS